jgi:3-methyladenine DNA glycosylase/8-oxoguanine DNA glycosylase
MRATNGIYPGVAITHSRRVSLELDIPATFRLHCLGRFDPTATVSTTHFDKRHVDRHGRIVRHLVERVGGDVVVTTSVDGNEDDTSVLCIDVEADVGVARMTALSTLHPLVRALHRRMVGMRLLPVPWTFDVVAGVVLQQRVAFADAARAFGLIAHRHGVQTDEGPCFPSPAQVLALTVDDFIAIGVDPKRARALRAVAAEMERTSLLRPFAPSSTLDERVAVLTRDRARLARLPGIGPWTIGMTMGFSRGDADAVVVGDLHLPHLVTATLGAGRGQPTDERMLELLGPFAGERFRVTRLLWQGGLGKRG